MISSVSRAAMGTGFIFLMTSLGAAMVFLFPGGMKLRFQAVMMGFAGGVMMAASVWSMLLPALEQAEELPMPCWVPAALGTLAGTVFLAALDSLAARRIKRSAVPAANDSLLMTAITLHNIPEGMAVGLAFALAGNAEGLTAAIALALGIGVQNFPEGAAVSLPMRQLGLSRGRAFLMGVFSGAVEPVFGMLAVFAASGVHVLMPWLLSFSAGAMIYVVVCELIPAAKDRPGLFGFMGGFLMMMLLDVALG